MVVVKAHLSEARHLDFYFLYHLGPRALARAPTLEGLNGAIYLYTVLCVRSRILGVHEGGRDNLRGGCTRLASSEKGVYGLEHVETDEREGRQFDVRESRVLSCFLVRSRGSGMWTLIGEDRRQRRNSCSKRREH